MAAIPGSAGRTNASSRAYLTNRVHEKLAYWGTPENGYRDSGFWEWVKYVRTNDNHDDSNPIKPLPLHKPHIILAFTFLLGCPRLVIPKSRQIMISWVMATFAVWCAWRRPLTEVLFQTKKEDDAFAMVSQGDKDPLGGRMSFIWNHLPGWLTDRNIKSGRGNKVGELVTDKASRILAIPAGPTQVASHSPFLFMSDEAALQEDFEDTYYRIMPAVKGGGRFVAASTANPSFMAELIKPATDEDLIAEMVPEWISNLKPVKDCNWYLSRTGHMVLDIGYASDPEKDPATEAGRAWVKTAAMEYPLGVNDPGWLREMERQWDVMGGKLVFEFLADPNHKVFVPMADPHLVVASEDLYMGFDYGTQSPSAAIVWGISPEGRITSRWELYEPCRSYKAMAKKIITDCPYFRHLKGIWCDPSLKNRTQMVAGRGSDEATSMLTLFGDEGLQMTPGRRGADYAFVMRLLGSYWHDPANPRAFISAATPKLAWELRRLRWQEHRSEATRQNRNAPEKIVDVHNHAFDASAYIFESRERSRQDAAKPRSMFSVQNIMESIKQANRPKLEGYVNG